MTYAFVMDVPAPIEFYDALHAEIARRTPGGVEGILLHIGRATRTGFQVIEVWKAKEEFDRFNAETLGPVLAELSGGQPSAAQPALEEFEPRGLIIPSAQLAV
jgi:hypothetical protein